MTMRRLLPLPVVVAAFGCNQCEAPPQPAAGNVERPADIVVVTPPDQDHTLAFVSNPDIEQIRIFDVSQLPEGAFLQAPNVFFPLSIRTGPATSDLAAPRGLPSRILALDTADDHVLVLRTAADDGGEAFTRVGAPIPTTGEPAAIDAALAGDDLVVWIALPDDGALEAIALDPATGDERGRATLQLQDGARPTDVAVDPTGATVVVADAVKGAVSIVDAAAFDGDGFADGALRTIDVGGPTRRVAVGRVPLADGMAPVAVLLRRDAREVAALRLFRPGFREERAALLGRAEVPNTPTTAYVPDQALPGAGVVCCQGLESDAIEAGEATAAWAALGLADGVVMYLALAAQPAGGGAPQVRLIDENAEGVGFETDPNTTAELWIVPDGASSPRPTAVITPVDNFGQPPFVPIIPQGAQLILTWQGPLPGVDDVGAELDDGALALDTIADDLADLDVRAGDLVEITVDDPTPGCDATAAGSIAAVAGETVDVADLSDAEVACLEGGGALRATVRAGEAFVVDSTDRGPLGRLIFDERPENSTDEPAADASLALPGALFTVRRNPDGDPATDSVLGVPLVGNVLSRFLNLSRDPADDLGGFLDLARQPIAMAGGPMKVPDGEEDEALLDARRILLITPARLFSFDEGETNVREVASYR